MHITQQPLHIDQTYASISSIVKKKVLTYRPDIYICNSVRRRWMQDSLTSVRAPLLPTLIVGG